MRLKKEEEVDDIIITFDLGKYEKKFCLSLEQYWTISSNLSGVVLIARIVLDLT